MIHEIPFLGDVFTEKTTTLFVDDDPRCLLVHGSSLYPRFAVKILDDGLEGLNIHPYDYLIFSQTGWPQSEGELCFIRIGDEVIVRSIYGLFDTEPLLGTVGDRYTAFRTHRNDFIVQGRLIGRLSPEEVEWTN